MAKVSIVVPCFKVEKYLDRCVESLVNQTLKDIEIILIDDESPDKVPEMCDNWAQRDTRIKVVHKKNGGLGMACNLGIEVATGDYIAFCDSDDYVDPECYETMYNKIIEHNADAVYSGIKRVNEHGEVTPMSQALTEVVHEGDDLAKFQLGMIASEPYARIERYCQMSAKIVLYSLDIIRSKNIRFKSEREYISEDLLFNLDYLQSSKKAVEIPFSFYYYYVNTSSLSNTVRKDRFSKNKILREYLIDHYDYGKNQADYINRVNKMFIGYTRSVFGQIAKSDLKYSDKTAMYKKIASDDIWEQLYREFPFGDLYFPNRLIFLCTLLKITLPLYILFKLKGY